ncbi:hypothetical protein [Streptomyces pseudovenezuelae]|uniref:hypothetical protein n=1 Tax=Streptomyces pseudovenezuelae TaxID=67350 RepID=UPI002E36AEE2|nr:hypothetical protein [Streptomyces pseudovenezuelae]
MHTRSTGGEYRRPATGIGELLAFGYIRESLISAGLDNPLSGVTMASAFPASFLTGNIISLGGTQYNEISKILLSQCDQAFIVDNATPKRILDVRNGSDFVPALSQGKIVIDYGVLTKVKNPFNPDSVAFVLRGSHTYGTAACAKVLTPKLIKEVMRMERQLNVDCWQAVIRARVVEHDVFPEVVSFSPISVRPIDPSSLPS